MIRYENVHKVFGTVDVLKGISFEIPTGKVVCILGHFRELAIYPLHII